MGSASSKFKKLLFDGDEYAAMQVYQNSPELRRLFDPDVSYGEQYQHNTPIHIVSKHGMKHLLRIFLDELHGNPNKRNSQNETALHCSCSLPLTAPPSAQERRYSCAQLILQWKGELVAASGNIERIDLQAQDMNGNTALHLAAASGLKRVTELLVTHGAPLFLENTDRLTPCDVAMKANFHDIALFLESRMVFAPASTEPDHDAIRAQFCAQGEPSRTNVSPNSEDSEEVYVGLGAQDLQEAKDQLVVETADMLHVPLFTAEALLRDNEWSRDVLLEKWMTDPVDCCEAMGLPTPMSALRIRNPEFQELNATWESSGEYLEVPPTSPCKSMLPEQTVDCSDDCCGICFDAMEQAVRVRTPCEHNFCRRCWSNYLTLKISEGVHHVTCPALGCSFLIPVELIESLVSKETARKYLHFDLNSFVATNPTIKWCPKPGCGRAVRLPENYLNNVQPNMLSLKRSSRMSHAVDCGSGHFFCWECLSEAHSPAGCEQWKMWQEKVVEIRPEELKTTCSESEDAANCYWLVTNCKACPNCKSPIQKNEGCNHMKCSKCKFDFCWVCLDSWKKHSSATGGYFRCNRYEAMHKADEKQGSLISEAGQRNKKLQELNRFIHYYTRYKNHDNSRLLEEVFIHSARRKMGLLAATLPAARSPVVRHFDWKGDASYQEMPYNQTPACTRFIEKGIRELIKARRILCGSYVYGYYLEDNGYNKTIFEFMQNELESFTEKLSEMVARPYLRTPRQNIIEMTAIVRRKRRDFMRAVAKGLIPPETPPALRRVRKRRFPGLMGLENEAEDEQITEAIAASLRQLDPNNPWVKDSQGRHTNLSAIYDWPDANSDEEDSNVNQSLTVSLLGVCDRVGCGKARARNPRTGEFHSFCSLRCSRYESFSQPSVLTATADFTMDLVIALEMSRLQLIEDEVRKQHREQSASSSEVNGGPVNMLHQSEDVQLRLAIHLSLEECQKKGNGIGSSTFPEQQNVSDMPTTSWAPSESQHSESEGHFEISELHQNNEFFSSSVGEEQHPDTSSDGVVPSLPFPRRSRSACDIRMGGNNRCPLLRPPLELDTHKCTNCKHKLVEDVSQGPPTRKILRLQSLGTDYDSDEFVGGTSSEDARLSEDEAHSKTYAMKRKLDRQVNVDSTKEEENERCSCYPSSSTVIKEVTSDSDSTNPICTDHPYNNQAIPRSPNLHISGVTISHTPEPESSSNGNKSLITLELAKMGRSSSLTAKSSIRLGLHEDRDDSRLRQKLSKSAGRLDVTNNSFAWKKKTSDRRKRNREDIRRLTLPAFSQSETFGAGASYSPFPSPRTMSRSACEPQRDKEVFNFPKSPTESQLSSVLLVRNCNTRDAFHEALFLPRSPSDQRRKRSKSSSATSTSTKAQKEEPDDNNGTRKKVDDSDCLNKSSSQESSVL